MKVESPSMDTSGQLALPANIGMDEHEYDDLQKFDDRFIMDSSEGLENALGNVLRLNEGR